MRNVINQDRYQCGWNDIAEGCLRWTNNDKWPDAKAWCQAMMDQAEALKLTCVPHQRNYYDGVIAACQEYLSQSEIVRIIRRTTIEINELVS